MIQTLAFIATPLAFVKDAFKIPSMRITTTKTQSRQYKQRQKIFMMLGSSSYYSSFFSSCFRRLNQQYHKYLLHSCDDLITCDDFARAKRQTFVVLQSQTGRTKMIPNNQAHTKPKHMACNWNGLLDCCALILCKVQKSHI